MENNNDYINKKSVIIHIDRWLDAICNNDISRLATEMKIFKYNMLKNITTKVDLRKVIIKLDNMFVTDIIKTDDLMINTTSNIKKAKQYTFDVAEEMANLIFKKIQRKVKILIIKKKGEK